MPERFPLPEIPSDDPADRPLSRKERRGKKNGKQQTTDSGRVHDFGRASVPAAKHMNYRRG
ncbi:hypothetical protein [Nocardia seriolae]|uniref:Uncharacterized protein n=1 Tax=Nocardia seriolae TaxID=37332 RepID=A0A0B8NF80_9NOCA|nr:hypothetical protein [Nocardia seriolae]APA99785.1 hypothetical protein NS506_05742 [Nocardia seriolae]MTJ62625.1 hypothetical protein [Nocardia seriolae]MTJ75427.1 hypothetical protein [Nocardia seriolae]MTJ89335.1 hypothetical protein [Nocardia seriolae]MTK33312.1 hypothetical protein [Nocardia seriolae]